MIKTVGLITYHYPHLKTEQVLQRLLCLDMGFEFRMYALPFTPRKPRETLFHHRPDQSDAVAPQAMAEKHKIPTSFAKRTQTSMNPVISTWFSGQEYFRPSVSKRKRL